VRNYFYMFGRKKKKIETAAILSLTVLTVVLFVWVAKKQSVLVNINMYSADQSAYMNYAKAMARTNLLYVGERNRMPFYPSLMSFFYREGMSDQEFFQRGKNVGIALALLVSFVAFLLFRRFSTPLDASVATLVAMFTVFAYKAPYFQAEVLFYGIGFILFYLLLFLVHKPQIKTALLAGITAGIGHLTKASVFPALLLAGLLVVVRGVVVREHHDADTCSIPVRKQPRCVLTHMCYAMVLLGSFLLVVLPYIRTSKQRFGHYFYNVNSTFYMWYDSWEEVMEGTRAHGDHQSWPDMPVEQIPSFRKYLEEHSLRSIGVRVLRGFRHLLSYVANSYGYAGFLVVYVVALLLLFGQNRAWNRSILLQTHPCVLLFLFGYFAVYILLYAWYTPIAVGNRFVLSLFLPTMLVILLCLSLGQSHNLHFICFKRKLPASVISPFILFLLLAYLLTVFPQRISTMYGGV
jgi:hypothetical protein